MANLIACAPAKPYISAAMRRLTLPSLLCVPLLSIACADDPQSATADDGGETGTTTGGDDDPVADTGGTGAAGEESTGTEPEFVPIPARGITITKIEVNQGVEVPVYANGAWVDGSARNAELVKGRNTFFRAYWELEEGFEPRNIEAKLTLFLPDGTTEVATQVLPVEGPSIETDLDTTFSKLAPGELVLPGLKFQLELFETDFGYEDTPEPAQTAFPAEPSYVGIEPAEMTLRVMLVPVQHDLGPDCPDVPVIDDQSLAVFEDELYMQNPVERVEVMVRDTYTYTDSLNSFGSLLGALANLRDADGADPGTYYYGVVRPCDGGPDGVGGQAIDIPGFPTKGNGWSRTAVGRWYGGVGSTVNTFVHEIGHTQGRRHVYCSGEEGGADPSYPYDGGTIGVWGFGVLDYTLHKPTTAKDYMTYCGNTWVSDWGWHNVYPYIEEITSWDAEGGAVDPSRTRQLLVGLVDPAAGTEHWFTTTGSATGRAPAVDRFEIATDAGVTELPATYGSMGESDAYNVVVELPETVELRAAERITRIQGTTRTDLAAVRMGPSTLTLKP